MRNCYPWKLRNSLRQNGEEVPLERDVSDVRHVNRLHILNDRIVEPLQLQQSQRISK